VGPTDKEEYYGENGLFEYSAEKKEKRFGVLRKFFDLFQFKDDEVYF
jgi:hypothetical protein